LLVGTGVVLQKQNKTRHHKHMLALPIDKMLYIYPTMSTLWTPKKILSNLNTLNTLWNNNHPLSPLSIPTFEDNGEMKPFNGCWMVCSIFFPQMF
jgi:hypothetical protein